MVTQFPLDYMHLICLGVMRRLIWLWTKSPLEKNIRLSAMSVQRLSDSLLQLKSHVPSEFARKCRPVSEIDRWKATEFRQFLLYCGPVVLKGILPVALYSNFLLLSVGIFCLVSPSLCYTHCGIARALLHTFVSQAGVLYGQDVLVYNVHGILHVADDVNVFGPLDTVSAFPFENFLGQIKRLVRKPNLPLQQVVHRLAEKKAQKKKKTKIENALKKQHFLGPLPPNFPPCNQFHQLKQDDVLISADAADVRDNCVKIGNDFCLLRNIVTVPQAEGQDIFVVHEHFTQVRDFFDCPFQSSDLGISLVNRPSGHMQVSPLEDIVCKYYLLPFRGSFVAIPLLHLL
ncbi:uncharacterized protein [Littorina saxatilis]|uniref:uncharacterized protein n=1 Tax=Littorina saxatilis TaxID=31220 RepID=UPI0038B50B6B